MPVLKNNFMIGLGGAGALALANFRRLSEATRREEFTALDTMTEYLCIDSSGDNFPNPRMNDYSESSIWKHNSIDLSLYPNDYILLNRGDLSTLIEEYNERNEETIPPINAPCVGAGQIRRYGRQMLRNSGAGITNALYDRLLRVTSEDSREPTATVHIFASCLGGTGSGCLVDIITTLQALSMKNGIRIYIMLYLFVAGENGKLADIGSGHLNQYYTLRDLDALATKRYLPQALVDDLSHVYASAQKSKDRQSADLSPISRIYISSDHHLNTDYNSVQHPRMAELCFDSIVAAHQGVPATAFTGYDLLSANPGEPINSASGDDLPDNSYCYAVAGISRWSYPTTEIKTVLRERFKSILLSLWINGFEKVEHAEPKQSIISDRRAQLESSELNASLSEYENFMNHELNQVFIKAENSSLSHEEALPQMTRNALRVIQNIYISGPTEVKYSKLIHRDIENMRREMHKNFLALMSCRDQVSVYGLKKEVKQICEIITNLSSLFKPPIPKLMDFEKEYLDENRADTHPLAKRIHTWNNIGYVNRILGITSSKLFKYQKIELKNILHERLHAFRNYWSHVYIECLIRTLLEPYRDNLQVTIDSFSNERDKSKDRSDQSDAAIRTLVSQNNRVSHAFYDLDIEYYDTFLQAYDLEAIRVLQDWLKSGLFATSEGIADLRNTCTFNDKTHKELLGVIESHAQNLYVKCHDNVATYIGVRGGILLPSIYDRILQRSNGHTDKEDLDSACAPLIKDILDCMHLSARIDERERTILAEIAPYAKSALLGLPPAELPAKEDFYSQFTPKQRYAVRDYLALKLPMMMPHHMSDGIGRQCGYELNTHHDVRLLSIPYWMPARFINVLHYTKQCCEYTWQNLSEQNTATRVDAARRVFFAQIDDKDAQKRDITIAPNG